MPLNFLDYYNNVIAPKLKSLDIVIKSNEADIAIDYISCLLDLSENEIKYILKCKNISQISSKDIITIMLNGTSYICKIFRKAINIGCPIAYTAEELAYIYILDYDTVKKIYKNLNIDKASSQSLPEIFKHITYKAYPLQHCLKQPYPL